MAIRKDWLPDGDRVIVVAARHARGQAIKYSVYHSQNHRPFQPSRWIAFYSDKQIDTVAEIDGPPEDDVVIAHDPEFSGLAEEMDRLDQGHLAPHSLFRLKNVREIGPILNDKIDKNGNLTPWTQKQRYTNIARLRGAQRTSEL